MQLISTQFITIQDGAFTINVAHIATIEWHLSDRQSAPYADIQVAGQEFTCEGKDLEALKAIVGVKTAIAV